MNSKVKKLMPSGRKTTPDPVMLQGRGVLELRRKSRTLGARKNPKQLSSFRIIDLAVV
jgi:hypothetical protein